MHNDDIACSRSSARPLLRVALTLVCLPSAVSGLDDDEPDSEELLSFDRQERETDGWVWGVLSENGVEGSENMPTGQRSLVERVHAFQFNGRRFKAVHPKCRLLTLDPRC